MEEMISTTCAIAPIPTTLQASVLLTGEINVHPVALSASKVFPEERSRLYVTFCIKREHLTNMLHVEVQCHETGTLPVTGCSHIIVFIAGHSIQGF